MIPMLALALGLAIEMPQLRTTETLPGPLTVALDTQRETVTITAHPPERLKVRSIVMDLPDSRSWAKPTKSESLAKNDVRATFRHPRATYAFVVTLDDDTQYRVTVTSSGLIEVLAMPPSRDIPSPRILAETVGLTERS